MLKKLKKLKSILKKNIEKLTPVKQKYKKSKSSLKQYNNYRKEAKWRIPEKSGSGGGGAITAEETLLKKQVLQSFTPFKQPIIQQASQNNDVNYALRNLAEDVSRINK